MPIYHMTVKILLLNLSNDSTKSSKYFFYNTRIFVYNKYISNAENFSMITF